jgi:hypothetical protein
MADRLIRSAGEPLPQISCSKQKPPRAANSVPNTTARAHAATPVDQRLFCWPIAPPRQIGLPAIWRFSPSQADRARQHPGGQPYAAAHTHMQSATSGSVGFDNVSIIGPLKTLGSAREGDVSSGKQRRESRRPAKSIGTRESFGNCRRTMRTQSASAGGLDRECLRRRL